MVIAWKENINNNEIKTEIITNMKNNTNDVNKIVYESENVTINEKTKVYLI